MRSIYRRIAKKHGVSASEVKREMQEAIDYAYKYNTNNKITVAYQNQVPCEEGIPTTEEFIRFLINKLENEK
ncbi:MAG: sporulation initiation factor Spo0A C-terminal domain-containing protein [Eubacteriaceae bacterium]